ncbi:MAG: hypothetical protein ACREXS_03810, partial [Gammaproteobacteria bacterium]
MDELTHCGTEGGHFGFPGSALINQIRGLLGEYGIVFAQGPGQVRRGLVRLLGDNEPGLSGFAL